MTNQGKNHLLSQLHLPSTDVSDTGLRLFASLPELAADVVARGIESLCENPLRQFDLYLETSQPEIDSAMLVLAYEKPHSVVALTITGTPGIEVGFQYHRHPGGEDTLQLRGVTCDGKHRFHPGAAWSLAEDSRHHPRAILDQNGKYLALTYWPENTQAL